MLPWQKRLQTYVPPASGSLSTDFSEYARICGALGIKVTDAAQLDDAIAQGLAHSGPALIHVIADPELV